MFIIPELDYTFHRERVKRTRGRSIHRQRTLEAAAVMAEVDVTSARGSHVMGAAGGT